jgi:hypothetical protein
MRNGFICLKVCTSDGAVQNVLKFRFQKLPVKFVDHFEVNLLNMYSVIPSYRWLFVRLTFQTCNFIPWTSIGE